MPSLLKSEVGIERNWQFMKTVSSAFIMSEVLCKLLRQVSLTSSLSAVGKSVTGSQSFQVTQIRTKAYRHIVLPELASSQLRRIVHFPEDGKYTVKPLKTTKLAGRDPLTGRVVHGKIGGGVKQYHRWVDSHRVAPKGGPPLVERVLHVQRDPTRNAFVAFTVSGDDIRYRIATTSMKAGDLITTFGDIPRIPVRPKEGDAHPLGALPIGTKVCCVENMPGSGARFAVHAGTVATVTRKVLDRVCIIFPDKQEYALSEECMATVGRVSNPEFSSTHIGSAQMNRLLGNRPCSGLWHRKTGVHGFKRHSPKKLRVVDPLPQPKEVIGLTLTGLPKIMIRPDMKTMVPPVL